MPKLVDTILNSNTLFTRWIGAAERWSGSTMKFPIKVSKNTNGSSFAGFDALSTTATNNRQLLSFDPKFFSIPVTLPLDELSANQTEAKVLDLAAIEVQSAAQDMADDIGTLFYADGTGNGGKDFLGLEAIVDDGTNAATYGSLARATFGTLDSTVTGLATLTLAGMRTLYNAITSGSQRPTLCPTTEGVLALYEQLLQPQERIMKNVPMMKQGMVGGTGFTALHYIGVPCLPDENATAQIFYFVNEDFMHWKALPVANTEAIQFKSQDIEGNDYSSVVGLGFSWSGWIKPVNQAALIGHVYLGGELLSDNPKRHGKLTGVAAV